MASHTKLIGDIGVAAVQLELLKHGISVLVPFDDNSKYDLIMGIDNIFYKIQVKTTEKVRHNQNGDIMEFATNITDPYNKTNSSYQKEDVDYFCLYCLENNWLGMINYDEYNRKRHVTMRITSPKNHNFYNISFAKDHIMHDKIKLWFGIDYLESYKHYGEKINMQIFEKVNLTEYKQPPSKTELEQLIYNTPFAQIGRQYGVNSNTVKKWCKKYGLPFRKKDMV